METQTEFNPVEKGCQIRRQLQEQLREYAKSGTVKHSKRVGLRTIWRKMRWFVRLDRSHGQRIRTGGILPGVTGKQ